MGSVKDLIILREPVENEPGEGVFVFSNRYSVFDWGEMPDHIPHKGEALCLLTAFFFERLEKAGFKTHYLGLLDENDNLTYVDGLQKPVNKMKVKLLRVIEPEYTDGVYDYSIFSNLKANYLIPLEVIYRFSLPEGSSVFKRLNDGSLKLEDMGLKEYPLPGTELPEPFIDFSTKLEHYDRYLSKQEAMEISGLSRDEFQKLIELAKEAAFMIKESYEKLGIKNEDGKFEFGVDENREIIVVDALGTPDECRFTKNGVTLSKEFARIFYRGSAWHMEVEKAKKEWGKVWREKVELKPDPLPKEDLTLLSGIYTALANAIIGKQLFSEAPSLDEVILKIKERAV